MAEKHLMRLWERGEKEQIMKIGTLTCLLIGHKFVMESYLRTEGDVVWGQRKIYKVVHMDFCVRCGIRESSLPDPKGGK